MVGSLAWLPDFLFRHTAKEREAKKDERIGDSRSAGFANESLEEALLNRSDNDHR